MKCFETVLFSKQICAAKVEIIVLYRFSDEIKLSKMYWQKILEG